MLIVYLEPLLIAQIHLLTEWNNHVDYWPRSWANTMVYNAAVPCDYWLLFHQQSLATQWLILYPEHSRIVRTLFDE
jgi:hypothetical protein